ncbi:molybdopterin molybdenumtransferase MoeA [Geomonas limicola]|uniref:Molybdopterin molybdenumtransferase n=1 Tax=Geomonas limicola TaxID=2740186 RepID=A0A6V8N1Z4_9BACT|nr:gephyrin-like molybdotransferase Glp [Geomonas limicola]GFO66492.1 molybdopterin molybdenumtransferase MoeA [Geomonas limicola]
MTTLEEATKIILARVGTTGCERVPLLDAQGRILAEDLTAPYDLPGWDTSAMDGFTVRSCDCHAGVNLPVRSFIPAGTTAPAPLEASTAGRIMTGAPIPPGADAVVPFEEAQEDGDTVSFPAAVRKGSHIRFQGSEIAGGATILRRGTLIGAHQVSLLASCSKAVVPVYRKPRVAILCTGDELVELGTAPGTGQVVNSNAFALAAAVREAGAVPEILGIARDTRDQHLALLTQGLGADLLITSAGVCGGDRDLVRGALSDLGVEPLFWIVAIRPGGPSACGIKGNTPVFSLPGTPSATMIAFELLVRPTLLKMLGHRTLFRRRFPATLNVPMRNRPGALGVEAVQARFVAGRLVIEKARTRGGHNAPFTPNALVLLAQERSDFAPGDQVETLFLDPSLAMEE